ncbi:MAG TPA: ubiquinone/menaquinone biosynthesis methyltransferase [Phycisphaerae bacterium]|nr:ubiquinone/menaquinone biosynthesis methyltransferase [Phycisphaerae bacterium]
MTHNPVHPGTRFSRDLRAMFAAVARRYDLLNHLLSANLDRRWRQHTALAAMPSRDRRVRDTSPITVVDVCTGTGDLAVEVLRRAPRARVVACDYCRPMLERARDKLARAGLARRTALVEADVLALPLPDASADAATCAFGLRNLNEPRRCLAEMVRILRPGGRVAILEFHRPRDQGALAGLFGLYFRHVLPRLGGWVSRGRHGAYAYLVASIRDFGPPKGVADAMREAGLDQVRLEPQAGGIASVYVGQKPCETVRRDACAAGVATHRAAGSASIAARRVGKPAAHNVERRAAIRR